MYFPLKYCVKYKQKKRVDGNLFLEINDQQLNFIEKCVKNCFIYKK